MNNATTFEDTNEVANDGIAGDVTVTTCDNCHGNQASGGAAAIVTAKAQWDNETEQFPLPAEYLPT